MYLSLKMNQLGRFHSIYLKWWCNIRRFFYLQDLIMICWTYNSTDRPDFALILKALDRLPKKPLHRSPSHPIHISRSAESVFTWSYDFYSVITMWYSRNWELLVMWSLYGTCVSCRNDPRSCKHFSNFSSQCECRLLW